MDLRYTKHYTREEARALLPQLRKWLDQLKARRSEIERFDKRIGSLMSNGHDIGGETVNNWIRALTAMHGILLQFQRREIQIKDLERGLIDFPAIIGGREVFLCWEQDEDDVEFWHDLDAGYGGREHL